jgi:hypothetical protein
LGSLCIRVYTIVPSIRVPSIRVLRTMAGIQTRKHLRWRRFKCGGMVCTAVSLNWGRGLGPSVQVDPLVCGEAMRDRFRAALHQGHQVCACARVCIAMTPQTISTTAALE